MNNVNLKTKNMALAGMFLAIGIMMPKVFHLLGPQAGKMFLPLFWGVSLSALILPLKYTLTVSALVPIVSYLISGMPPIPILYFMIIELISYGFFTNILMKKVNPFLSIGIGLLISRTIYILSVIGAAQVLKLQVPFSGVIPLVSGVLVSLPGIIMQIVIIPILYKIYLKMEHS